MAAFAMTSCGGGEGDDPAGRNQMRDMFGPQAVDHQIRQAISTCWMTLPGEKRNVEAVEAEIRHLVDRALRDLKEDASAFGFTA